MGGLGTRILLTGPRGQLGLAFQEVASMHEVVPLGREEADLADADAVRRAALAARPEAIVHAGALTNVDECERRPDLAHRVNALATSALAQAAREVGARFVYVSTDYVFDGEKGAYQEADATRPLSAYGKSKLAGETAALAAHPEACIARTSVVFGPHKKNFVTWVVDELRAGRSVRLAEDQRVSPTLAHDLARAILALLDARATGVWHAAGASALTRIEMGELIARAFSLDASLIQRGKLDEIPWLAPRPRDSSLDVSKLARVHAPMRFDDALAYLKEKRP